MNASDLRFFEAVARLGGMNRAAAELNTVQSNVTARIRALEEDLGTPLFVRSSRGVSLTPAGRRLLPHAARVRLALEDARRAALDDGTPRGPLSIGSLETTAAHRLSPVLAAYGAAHPGVDLSVRTATNAVLVSLVLDDRLDGAFVCGPVAHPDLARDLVFVEELALVTAPGGRGLDGWLRADGLKLLVKGAGCSYRDRLERILARRGLPEPRRMEFGTLEAILGCAAAGLGVTLLPRGLAEPARREGRVAVHPLPEEEGRAETLFVRRAAAPLSGALAAFLDRALAAGAPTRAAGWPPRSES
jgi:DNA-binding transcriptional LysR family regulator